MKKKYLPILIVLGVLILVGILLFGTLISFILPECDYDSGGWPLLGTVGREVSCDCIGLKFGFDDRPADGSMRYGCLGIITSKECSEYEINQSWEDRIIRDCK